MVKSLYEYRSLLEQTTSVEYKKLFIEKCYKEPEGLDLLTVFLLAVCFSSIDVVEFINKGEEDVRI